jgi:transposase
MQANVEPRVRRVHAAEIKSKVLAECRRPGASVSAVALAHGLNANLVRKWLKGRGLQRAGLKAAEEATVCAAPSMPPGAPAALQFVPVQMPAPGQPIGAAAAPAQRGVSAAPADVEIHIELRRGGSQMAVRWPATRTAECASWLRELARAVLGARP